jgi:cell cycle related kinase
VLKITRMAKMNRYTIIGRIGEGAHGLVLKAYDNASPVPKIVALKRILLKRIEDGIPTSILREVKTLQLLKHPYVRMSLFIRL